VITKSVKNAGEQKQDVRAQHKKGENKKEKKAKLSIILATSFYIISVNPPEHLR